MLGDFFQIFEFDSSFHRTWAYPKNMNGKFCGNQSHKIPRSKVALYYLLASSYRIQFYYKFEDQSVKKYNPFINIYILISEFGNLYQIVYISLFHKCGRIFLFCVNNYFLYFLSFLFSLLSFLSFISQFSLLFINFNIFFLFLSRPFTNWFHIYFQI